MADITKVKEAATRIKNQDILSILEKTGINSVEVQKLKAEVDQATNKNEIITRVLSTPSALCEQIKGIIRKIKG